MNKKHYNYFIFFIFLLCSSISHALTKSEEKNIIDKSSDVIVFLKYLTKRNIPTSRLKYKVIENGNIFTTTDGYLHEKQTPTHWKKHLPLARSLLVGLNHKGKIISLSLSQGDIEDLTIFKKLTKLRALRFVNNNFKSHNLNVSGLLNLEELTIISSNFDTITIGSNLNKLRTLHLSSIKNLTTIKNLNNLKNLRRLNIQSTSVSNIKGLTNLKKLKWLDIEKSPIKSLPSMKHMKKLESLIALDTKLTDVKDIRYSKLKEIDLHLTIAAEKVKVYPKSLERLRIGGEHVKSIPLLNNYKNLRKLTIIGGEFKKIHNFQGLTNLRELDLRSSTITKIEGLDDLIALEKLNFTKTKITKIEGLHTLVNLKDLDFTRTDISKIEGLERLKSLELLNFTYTKVKKVENLGHLKKLKIATFSMCDIQEYNYKATLHNIVDINIFETPFAIKLKMENTSLYDVLRKKNKI